MSDNTQQDINVCPYQQHCHHRHHDATGPSSSERLSVQVDNDPKKLVSVCNATVCDKLEFKWPDRSGEAYLIQSCEKGLRFNIINLSEDGSQSSGRATSKLHVNLNVRYQKILGWGGAFTDAATINIANLSEMAQENLLASYYGEHGLQYNFGRVPIGGSDFSTRAYSYADSDEPDYDLTKWRLQNEDLEYKIPAILRAAELAMDNNVDLKLLASPWSPPKWMKTSNSFVRGHLIDEDRVYDSYANYLIKFYEAYRRHGIKFWGATIQNEPISSYLPIYFFNSLQMSSSEAIKLITRYLGPKLRARGYTKKNFKLMIGDDSLGFIDRQVQAIVANEEMRNYVSGFAFHWYTSGTLAPYRSISKLYDSVKDHIEFVMMSEACNGGMPFQKHVMFGSWDRGQAYANDIINDLQRHTNSWIDWNLALNMEGGPNWSGNFVDSPILVNSEKDEFYKQPTYYVLAHFSRFFKEGSVRVYAKLDEPGLIFKQLSTVAVHNEETGHLIVNILNKSNKKKPIQISIDDVTDELMQGMKAFTVEPKSISTLVIKL